MESLPNLFGYFVAVSLATERITEAIKGLPLLSTWLAIGKPANSTAEFIRKTGVRVIAGGVATSLAYFAGNQLPGPLTTGLGSAWTYLLFGAMSSGGAGMWNSVLDIANQLNYQKQFQTQQLAANPGAGILPASNTANPMPAPPAPVVKATPPPAPKEPKAPTNPPAIAPIPAPPSKPAATGDQILQVAGKHVGEKYVLSARVPKDDAHWAGPWNCSEFVSWAVFQISKTLYGCDNDKGDPATAHAFTGYWNNDADKQGQIISIEQAARTPGAAVLRLPQPGATGHIVISNGKGGTVEAHSQNDGVIESTLNARRWDLAILVPGITYTEGPIATVSPPNTTIYRLVNPPMTGNKVLEIQERLKAEGLDPGPLDGEFGPYTHAAVVAFQTSHGLVSDGEVGQQTAAALGLQIE